MGWCIQRNQVTSLSDPDVALLSWRHSTQLRNPMPLLELRKSLSSQTMSEEVVGALALPSRQSASQSDPAVTLSAETVLMADSRLVESHNEVVRML